MAYDIVGLGYSAVDYLGIAPAYPALDAKVELEELSVEGGGVVATAMVAAARLGAKVSYIGAMGDDPFGSFALSELRREGVDTGGVVIRPGASSPFSLIVIDRPSGKRNIFWSRSGLVPLSPQEIDREHILSGKVLHLDNHEPAAAIEAAGWAKEAGITVLIDAGSVRPGVRELLGHVDVLVASHRFAQEYAGEGDAMAAARAMLKGRIRISVVTNGEHGCACATADESFEVPSFKVDVVDTTGAGDVFHGAFSFGLARGWDVRTTATFASAVAAIKCTRLGGRQGIPTFEQAVSFLSEHGARVPPAR